MNEIEREFEAWTKSGAQISLFDAYVAGRAAREADFDMSKRMLAASNERETERQAEREALTSERDQFQKLFEDAHARLASGPQPLPEVKTVLAQDMPPQSGTQFICRHGTFPNPCKDCAGTFQNSV